jgi:hypothetical protein
MAEPQEIPQALLRCCEDQPCPNVTDTFAAINWILLIDELEALQAVQPEATHLNNVQAPSPTLSESCTQLQMQC